MNESQMGSYFHFPVNKYDTPKLIDDDSDDDGLEKLSDYLPDYDSTPPEFYSYGQRLRESLPEDVSPPIFVSSYLPEFYSYVM